MESKPDLELMSDEVLAGRALILALMSIDRKRPGEAS